MVATRTQYRSSTKNESLLNNTDHGIRLDHRNFVRWRGFLRPGWFRMPEGGASPERQALENEYTPSLWSKRFPNRTQVLQHHVQFVSEASDRATATVPNQCNISYGDAPAQKLDIFGTDLPDDAPILVYIHGGFWQELSRDRSRYAAPALHARGVKTAVLGYELCPAVPLREIVRQVFAGAKFVLEMADRIGSRGVYFAGHSAGAHLVAKLISNPDFLASVPSSRLLQGAFLISGVFDLTELVETTVNDCLGLSKDEARRLSPHFNNYYHLREKTFRIYILAGQNDSLTFKKQSREFYELLMGNCRVKNMYFEIKDGFDHFDIVECLANEENYLKNLVVFDIMKYL